MESFKGELKVNANIVNRAHITEKLLLSLTECESLADIRVISLKNKLLNYILKVLSQCYNLSIAYLQGNRLSIHEYPLLATFQNLFKLDLSGNNLKELPTKQTFSHMYSLRLLYLHDNQITTWEEMSKLTSLPNILHITLFENSCTSIEGYRLYMVNSIPTLIALDHHVITDEERIEGASFEGYFQAQSENMRVPITDYSHENSAERHIFNLEIDIWRLKRLFERSSPVIRIQTYFRGYRQRKVFKRVILAARCSAIKIQKRIRGYLVRKRNIEELRKFEKACGLDKERDPIVLYYCRLKFFQLLYNARRRIKWRAVLLIQRIWRGKMTRTYAYIRGLEIKHYKRIYTPNPDHLKRVLENIGQKDLGEYDLEELKQSVFGQDHERNLGFEKYESIRIVENEDLKENKISLFNMIHPTLRSLIRKKKAPFEFKNVKLANLYFCPWQEIRDQLNMLKMRNSRVSLTNAMNQLKDRNVKQTRNNPNFTDTYMDLHVFDCPTVKIFHAVTRLVNAHNSKAVKNNEPPVLIFYEKLMIQIAAATLIQANFRSHLKRKFGNRGKPFPIEILVERRALYCIQHSWKNYKMERRLRALSEISRMVTPSHKSKPIDSDQIYIELNLYNNIVKIVESIKERPRFHEQYSSFMFAQESLYVNPHPLLDGMMRYPENLSCPDWFILDLFKFPKFYKPEYVNELIALFHYGTTSFTQLKRYSDIVDVDEKGMDVQIPLYFVEINCRNVEEARKRVCILAYLTYDITKGIFVKMFSKTMLEDPFFYSNIRKCWAHFGITEETEEDKPCLSLASKEVPKGLVQPNMKRMYPHSGFILTDDDSILAQRDNDPEIYEQIMSQKSITITTDRNTGTQVQHFKSYTPSSVEGAREELDDRGYTTDSKESTVMSVSISNDDQIISRPDSNISLGKQRTNDLMMNIRKHAPVKKFEVYKEAMANAETLKIKKFHDKCKRQEETLKLIRKKHDDIMKSKTIKKILKEELDKEMKTDKEWYNAIVQKEKLIRNEMAAQTTERDLKIKKEQKRVIKKVHSQQYLKKNQRNFCNAFTQAKNMIEKQIKAGNRIKSRNNLQKVLTEKVKEQKKLKLTSSRPIMIQNFDNSILTTQGNRTERSNSRIETNASMYNAGQELLSKYKIDPTVESYTTISNQDQSNLLQESGITNAHGQTENSETILTDLFPKNKEKIVEGFQTARGPPKKMAILSRMKKGTRSVFRTMKKDPSLYRPSSSTALSPIEIKGTSASELPSLQK